MGELREGQKAPDIYGPITEDQRLAWIEQAYAMFKDSVWNNRGMWYIFLRDWCGGKDAFRREFAYPYRRVSRGIVQLHKQILHFGCDKRKNCYLTNFEFRSFEEIPKEKRRKGTDRVERPTYSTAIVDKIPFEFDQSNACPKCLQLMKKQKKFWICERCGWTDDKLSSKYDAEYTEPLKQSIFDVWREVKKMWEFAGDAKVVFTGGRGFQLYKMLEEPILPSELLDVQKATIQAVPTKSLDDGHLGDVARVYRIPFTLHATQFRFCIPVEPDWSMKEIIRRSMLSPKPDVVKPVQFRRKTYDEEERKEIFERVTGKTDVAKGHEA